MTSEQFLAANVPLYRELHDVMRRIKFVEEQFLTSIDAHPVDAVVETIEGASSNKPRRLTMRIAGRAVENGEPWYYLTSDITGTLTGRAVTRFVPHTAIVSVLLPKVEPLPR